MKYYKIPLVLHDMFHDIYYDHELTPNFSIKCGGTPVSCQNNSYKEYDLLQLIGCKWLDYDFGDSGIAHISTDCHFKWDCC